MEQQILTAQIRTTTGKGAAKKLRREGQIPAVFYGPKAAPITLTLDYTELQRAVRQGAGENALFDLKVQTDQGDQSHKVMIKELLVDPVKEKYLHADFYEIAMDKEITLDIPIRLVNTPIGVEQGGILQHVRRELTISCMPDRLIDFIEADVAGLDIGDALHVENLVLPEGIASLDENHLTIATVAAPTKKEEEGEVKEAEEGIVEEASPSAGEKTEE